MNKNFRGYMNNVDELIERTPLDLVLSHYGLPLTQSSSGEYRMNCVFNEACSTSSYGNLCIELNAAKRIYCHTCQVKGNLLVLLHGLENHTAPHGGQLRGQEFKNAVAKLREINGLVDGSLRSEQSTSPQRESVAGSGAVPQSTAKPQETSQTEPAKPADKLLVNVPLKRHDKEAARSLEDLHTELIFDVAQMSPAAAAYVRARPWMTPELMQKWSCGWIPGNGRSLFRKHYFVYTHRNVRGEVISYSGRDLGFESKWTDWIWAAKPEGSKPSKHRYVAGYHRGIELFGALSSRLEDPQMKQSLSVYGLFVVEGMNDVMRLDELGICAVGLGSNRATETQVGMITKFAHQVAGSRVILFPDRDEEGTAGFKELLWQLAQTELQVRVVPPDIAAEAGKQPEHVTADEILKLKD